MLSVFAGLDQHVVLPAAASLDGTVFDAGLTSTLWSQISGPGLVSFADAAVEDTTANFSLGGVYVLRLTASSGGNSESDELTVTVNTPPHATPVADQAVAEGDVLNLLLEASDPDGHNLVAILLQGPGGIAGTTYLYEPAEDAANGSPYAVLIEISDGNGGSDQIAFSVTVQSVNRSPVLEPVAELQSVFGDPIVLLINASDPDGDELSIAATGSMPAGAVLTDLGTGTALFSWTPNNAQDDVGNHLVEIRASDGELTDTLTLSITVRLPDDIQVDAGIDQHITLPTEATLNGTVSGAALTSRVWSKVTGPGSVNFGNATSEDTTASFTAGGAYTLRLTALGPGISQFDEVQVTVNSPPEAPPVDDQNVNEGENFAVSVEASDPDGDIPVAVLLQGPGIIVGSTYVYTPDKNDVSDIPYEVSIAIIDGNGGNDQIEFSIQVGDGNRPPTLEPISNVQTVIKVPLALLISASDPDGDIPAIAEIGELPEGAVLTDLGNGTAQFTWTPTNASEVGVYNVDIAASDAEFTNTQSFSIEVMRPALVERDFDGDGISDMAVYQPDTGEWWTLYSGGGSDALQWNAAGLRPVPADYDGDGISDPAVFDPKRGVWDMLLSAGGERSVSWGWSETDPVPADYDGDGKADLAVYWPEEGLWYVLQSTDGRKKRRSAIPWGWHEAVPVPGDYDGDGRAELAVYAHLIGTWYILFDDNTSRKVNLGTSGTIPVPADYDGDGICDIGVYHPPTGSWDIERSSDGSMYRIEGAGRRTTVPIPGHHDGDRAVDACVFHANPREWYFMQSTDNDIVGPTQWGPANARPLLPAHIENLWYGK